MILNRFSPQFWLYFGACLASIALSLWLSSTRLINFDGILYLETAQAFLDAGVRGAYAVYSWPFYSILIAVTHQITLLSLEHAAILVNTLFCTLIVTAFIRLTASLGGTQQVQIFAAIVILLHTGLNDYRGDIFRDLGYLAFMLYSLYFFINYAQTSKLRYAFAWNASLFCAFLFRSEAIVLFLAPAVLLLPNAQHSLQQRLQVVFNAYLLPLCIVVGAFIIALLFSLIPPQTISIIPLLKIASQFNLSQAFELKVNALRAIFPQFVKDRELPIILASGVLGYFLVRCILLLSPLYTLMSGYAMTKHLVPTSIAKRAVLAFLWICIAVSLLFVFYKFFLSGRYLLSMILLLSLWAPFGISAIFTAWRARGAQASFMTKFAFPAVALCLIFMLGDSVISSGASKLYLKDAGIWLDNHSAVDAHVFTNNRELGYYSHRKTNNLLNVPEYKAKDADEKKLLAFFNTTKWKNFDYFAIEIKAKDTKIESRLSQLPLKKMATFENERGDKVIILMRVS